MNKRKFLLNSALLAVTSLVIRSMGIGFRVYMSNTIGAEGIGLYQLILTVYLFFATVTTTGINLFVTRVVTDFISQGKVGRAKRATTLCLILSIVISCVCGGFMFFFAEPLGAYFLKDIRTVLAIKILAPSLPFMAVSSCLRGYFFARRRVTVTSGEQLLEQILEIAVFALLVGTLAPKGLEYACCAVVLGTTAAEAVSCIYSLSLYALDIRKFKCKSEKVPGFFKKLISIALPVTGSSCLRTGLSAVENILIPSGLKKNGANYSNALSQYGMISGMVMPVLTFPSVFIMPIATLIIPEMSQANANGRKNAIHYMASRLFKISLLFSVPVMIIFIFFAQNLGEVIYGSKEVGTYIAILAPIVPLMYLDSVADGMLKGLDKQASYLLYNLIDSVIRVALTYFLLPMIGIKGFITVIFTSELLNTSLSIAKLLKVTELKLMIADWIIMPSLCILIPCVLLHGITLPFSPIPSLIIQLTAVVAVYIVLLRITGCINAEERNWFKGIIKGR